MTDQDKIDLLIDNYLKNRLKGEDLATFEQNLSSDEALQQQVQIHKLANELIVNNKLKDISTLARGIERKITLREKVVKYGIVAVIILSIATLGYFYFYSKDEIASTTKQEEKTFNSDSLSLRKVELSSSITAIKGPKEQSINAPKSPGNDIIANEKVDVVNIDSVHISKVRHENLDKVLNSVSSPEPLKSDIPLKKSDPCQGVQIEAQISTKGTCSKQENGAINIQHITGGLSPYVSYVLDSEGNKSSILKGFGVGEYTVLILDALNCSQRFPHISVPAAPCNEDFSFNPFIGEHWELPAFTQHADLKIFDRTSGLFFEKAFREGDQLQWDGHSNKGELKSGYFIFEIVFADGTRKNGSVTIVR